MENFNVQIFFLKKMVSEALRFSFWNSGFLSGQTIELNLQKFFRAFEMRYSKGWRIRIF